MAYEDAFSISPNPTLMVATPAIRGVLFKIRYCVKAKQGLSMIVGDFGLGKSTVLRALHSEMLFCSGRGGQRTGSKLDPLNHAATSDSRWKSRRA